ncbi:hypothetical protein Phou_026960 [Phytohabitans houttuyneae]|uniref:Uncharacterized protein n=1 Tax=Phytohabitans houttuyneae TaxID=1076126 RepID=A0A6V8K924_9ACTN|nr:hypothetical protein Phou_026960 [Phytohabitans houttuyneae]
MPQAIVTGTVGAPRYRYARPARATARNACPLRSASASARATSGVIRPGSAQIMPKQSARNAPYRNILRMNGCGSRVPSR